MQPSSSDDEESSDEDEQLLNIGDGQLAAADDIAEDDIQSDSDEAGAQHSACSHVVTPWLLLYARLHVSPCRHMMADIAALMNRQLVMYRLNVWLDVCSCGAGSPQPSAVV